MSRGHFSSGAIVRGLFSGGRLSRGRLSGYQIFLHKNYSWGLRLHKSPRNTFSFGCRDNVAGGLCEPTFVRGLSPIESNTSTMRGATTMLRTVCQCEGFLVAARTRENHKIISEVIYDWFWYDWPKSKNHDLWIGNPTLYVVRF